MTIMKREIKLKFNKFDEHVISREELKIPTYWAMQMSHAGVKALGMSVYIFTLSMAASQGNRIMLLEMDEVSAYIGVKPNHIMAELQVLESLELLDIIHPDSSAPGLSKYQK